MTEITQPYRQVQRKWGSRWRNTEMKALKKGMIFRLFEPDGTPVVYNEKTEFLVVEDPNFNNGVWGCESEPV